jgi:hypothetical protein
VRRLAATRLALVERELDELADRRDQLRQLVEICETGSDDDCLELTPPSPDAAP